MERRINSKFVFTGIRSKRKHLLKVINDLDDPGPCGECFLNKFKDCYRYQAITGCCNDIHRTDHNNCHFKLIRSQKLRQ